MTGGQLGGDHQRIASGGQRLTELAEHAKRIHGDLQSTLDETGDCWGDDEIGRNFADSHSKHAAEVLDRAGGLHGRMTDAGGRFVTAADHLRELDQGGASTLRQAGRPLD